ncbi:1,2-phenylacetyl-CoA epoxidase subunit PaaC [Neobacillus niacini]|uniref:1,2-phenylacetyl-CoA epoxidase subunit PaaC n=1 Tax=Neobacillus niacini TaxID=86668 RepID=UPI0028598049|nr:1,2-phenylacetyl-CoA epoxidase subunit PaaC [Neobacillus niacini]MDR6997670.1 ring-1,2-phenylacetyl-CoA epoxidase subunit PaaC [Neobacillus niacini]
MTEQNLTLTPEFKDAVVNLLFQLADDDFFYSYRGSEWLGLAPHIEEDVASSSISQDSMGHAAMFYQLLEEMGIGHSDALAHLRPANERKNSILVERPNGEGYYMDVPKYDWAYAVVRNYFYTAAKKVKIDSLKNSAYEPLAKVAVKVNMELYYHLLHWKTWFVQLLSSTDEAKQRMQAAIEQVMSDFGDVFSLGNDSERIVELGLIEKSDVLIQRWKQQLEPVLQSVSLLVPEIPANPGRNGRNLEHTDDLVSAIETLSEVYRLDTAASW